MILQLFKENFTLVIEIDYVGVLIHFPKYSIQLSTFSGFKKIVNE
jgi:hypothetical protein